MMETLYQNCVSQFDIDLLDHGTVESQNASLAVPNASARKQNLRFLKLRWKQVSDLVKRGKETNKALDEMQKLLFEKNEECKDLCNERNTLFNQANETSKEIEGLKAQNKLIHEKYLDAMNSVSATKIHSMQFKQLTIEFERIQSNLKKIERDCAKQKHAKEVADARLKRILTEFVPHHRKKDSKWLSRLFKTYDISKEGNNNYPTSEDSCDDEMFEEVPVPMSPKLEKTYSKEEKKSNALIANDDVISKTGDTDLVAIKSTPSDLDNFGSVDTGRGSSLAFSDKSFHSPEYYMNDSPLSNLNLCNKCNVPKSDVGTSPIPVEMLQVDICKPKLKLDASTSPVKILASNTSPKTSKVTSTVIEFEPITNENPITHLERAEIIKDYSSAVESDSCMSDDECSTNEILQSTETPSNVECIYEDSMEGDELQTLCKKDISSSQNSLLEQKLHIPESINTAQNTYFEENCGTNIGKEHTTEDIDDNHRKTTKPECKEDFKKGRLPDEIPNIIHQVDQSVTSNVWINNAELPNLSAKVIQNIRPSLELSFCDHLMVDQNTNDEGFSVCEKFDKDSSRSSKKIASEVTTASGLASSTENVTVLHIEMEEESNNSHIITEKTDSNLELTRQSEKLPLETITFEPSLSDREKSQKCLQLNSSDNLSHDNFTDNEVQSIISKMTSLHPIITPIPQTPSKMLKSPKRTLGVKELLPIVNKCDNQSVESHLAASEGIDEYLNIIRKKTREAVGFLGPLPGLIQKFIVSNMCKDKHNQELLSCLLQMESNNREIETENCMPEDDTPEMQPVFENDAETVVDLPVEDLTEPDIANGTNEPVLRSEEPKKTHDTIVYENVESTAEDDTLQPNLETDDANEDEGGGIVNLHRIDKKKLTKLQRFKLRVIPKCKIRQERVSRAKNVGFKPKTITSVPVKRKVTNTDSSATLNDRSVYNKAVKVVAELKAKNMLNKEARVLIDNCSEKNLRNSNKSSDISSESVAMEQDLLKDRNTNPQESGNMKKKSDTVSYSRILDNSSEQVSRKRKMSDRQTSDNINTSEIVTNENTTEDSIQIKRRRGRFTRKTSANEDVEMCDNNSDSEVSPRRRGIGSRIAPNNRTSNKERNSVDNELVTKKSKIDEAEPCQRILRSSNTKQTKNFDVLKKKGKCESIAVPNKEINQTYDESFKNQRPSTRLSIQNQKACDRDIDTAANEISESQRLSTRLSSQREETCKGNENTSEFTKACERNILCTMIEKYAVCNGFFPKKIPEAIINDKCDKLEKCLDSINEMPSNSCTDAMNKLVSDISTWKVKHFLAAFTKYLKDPQRKTELYKKTINPPAPTMTKKEQVWLYVLDQLVKSNWYSNLIEKVLQVIEYTLFTLNKTPEVEVIEAMSHFYALICRYYQKQSRLRLFVIDAMYCLSYKSIPLILQCLEVWMFILPLGHMGLAKTPLVSCLVYLLHFYKCGRDSSTAVQEMRTILNRKYYYDFSEWNETRILDMFRASILELRDSELEKKMLRMSIIILAKRSGPKWCQLNIIKNMLQPIIENAATSNIAKRFCILALGPLVKPYPNDMKSYCEVIAHYLMKKLEQNNSPKMHEAIVTSLLFMNRHNSRINEFLFKWFPNKISPEMEQILKDYVRSKSVKAWKHLYTDSVIV